MMPTLAGFIEFIRTGMAIDTATLPDNSPFIGWSYDYASHVVSQYAAMLYPGMYALMVYNLGADFLVNMAPDQVGLTTFADLRKQFGLDRFTPGVVSSTSDSGTSVSFDIPDFYKNLTFADLQLLRTPWGRTYFSLAQKFNMSWGLT